MGSKRADGTRWFLVPARGGSKGVPRKNVRKLGGRALIHHVLGTLARIAPQQHVIVSTDDEEIAWLSKDQARIHRRSRAAAGDAATLDDVAVEVCRWILDEGGSDNDLLVTIQPTSPFITVESIEQAVRMFSEGGFRSVLSVTDDRHLRWTMEGDKPTPLFEKRVNRQWLPPVLAETGGIIAARVGDILETGTRVMDPVGIVELRGPEALDIDDHHDWAIAQHIASRLRIFIRADASPKRGMGHVYRASALALEWADQQITLTTVAGEDDLARRFFATLPHDTRSFSDEDEFERWLGEEKADLVVLDVLNTTARQIECARRAAPCVVSLEDQGPGAVLADLVVNDLYPTISAVPQNQLVGIQHSVLAPVFETIPPRDKAPGSVERILITFGGTDPSGLTGLAVEALRGMPVAVDVVLGPGYQGQEPDISEMEATVHRSVDNMAALMRTADIAITSAGRTVTELLAMGVIPLVLCQNEKELTHTHASGQYGAMNIGLGKAVGPAGLRAHIQLLVDDAQLREVLWHRGRDATRDRSNAAICRRILDVQLECSNK